ncbi:peroxidase family protein [Paracoccus mutanolyticus]|uniref:peroxidase family protein n=1 Tax=Paracoccus mutanolyticus TaxID=1499308 RepID=UPI0037C962E2
MGDANIFRLGAVDLVAKDPAGNSTPYTAMLNTLFLREHNRLAGVIETAHTGWDDERVFQTARNVTIVLLIKCRILLSSSRTDASPCASISFRVASTTARVLASSSARRHRNCRV